MQRYKENNMELNNSLISFGPVLNLNKFTDDDIFNGNYNYNLKAKINHIGSVDYGHYFCFIKINNEWNKFSDCNVEVISEMAFKSDSVYVLIYELE